MKPNAQISVAERRQAIASGFNPRSGRITGRKAAERRQVDASAEHLSSLRDSRFVRVGYLGLKSEAILPLLRNYCHQAAEPPRKLRHTKLNDTPRVYPGGSLAFALLESPETIR